MAAGWEWGEWTSGLVDERKKGRVEDPDRTLPFFHSSILPFSLLPCAAGGGWLAREALVEHRSVVDEGGHDDGGFLQIFRLDAVEDILVRVVRAALVFNLVLDELE